MSSPSQLILDLSELCAHAVPSRFPFDQETALSRSAADEREAEKVKGLRFAETPLGARDRCEAAKLDQPGLVRVQRQRERREPLAHRLPEMVSVAPALETDESVVGVAHDDHVARRFTPSPALGPQVEHIVQVALVRLIVERIQLVAEFAVFESGRAFGKCLGHRHFLEEGDRENLKQSVERRPPSRGAS